MTGRGKGKYTYKQELRKKGEEHIGKLLKKYFKNNRIVYFSWEKFVNKIFKILLSKNYTYDIVFSKKINKKSKEEFKNEQ